MGNKKRRNRPPIHTSQAKNKPIVNDRHPIKSNFRLALARTFSSGWVQNSGVAFLLSVVAVIGAVMTSTQIKTAIIFFAGAGTIFLWIFAAEMIRSLTPEIPPFAFAMEFTYKGETRDATQMYARYGQFLSPIPIAMYVRLVNQQDVPASITKFKMEVEEEKRFWFLPNKWMRTVTIRDTMPLLWLSGNPRVYKEMQVGGGYLESIMENHVLAPHETIHGWVLLDVPAEFDTAPQPPIYRISIKDSEGHSVTLMQPTPMTFDENLGPTRTWTFLKVVDVSQCEMKHLADMHQ
jgi:hypothetical protein